MTMEHVSKCFSRIHFVSLFGLLYLSLFTNISFMELFARTYDMFICCSQLFSQVLHNTLENNL
jgi:hypothetical protein